MENEKIPGQDTGEPQEELLLNEDPDLFIFDNELEDPDELSVSDQELERIIAQTLAEDWGFTDDTDPLPEAPQDPEEQEYADEGEALESQPEEEAQEEPSVSEQAVPRKIRPKRKKGYGLFGLPHLASVAIWAAIVLFIGVSLGRLIWVCAADVLAFGRPDRDVSITISEGDDLETVTNKLYNAGLIKYRSLFKFYAKIAQVEEKNKISVGTFNLNTQYDYHALVAGMSATSSYRKTVEVVIPEGYSCAQIFKLLEESGVCTAAELEAYAMQSSFSSYWFLEDVEKGTKYCLEGYLFPDTYEFYTNDTPQRVFSKMLARFDDMFDDELKQMLEDLNAHLADKGYDGTLSVREVIIIASIIQKESAHTGELRDISCVIYNRLCRPDKFPRLEMKSPLVYILDGKDELTDEDMKLDSPFNTFVSKGLIPSPISNPGIFSLKAALNPTTDHNYCYFALEPDGSAHHFFEKKSEWEDFLGR